MRTLKLPTAPDDYAFMLAEDFDAAVQHQYQLMQVLLTTIAQHVSITALLQHRKPIVLSCHGWPLHCHTNRRILHIYHHAKFQVCFWTVTSSIGLCCIGSRNCAGAAAGVPLVQPTGAGSVFRQQHHPPRPPQATICRPVCFLCPSPVMIWTCFALQVLHTPYADAEEGCH